MLQVSITSACGKVCLCEQRRQMNKEELLQHLQSTRGHCLYHYAVDKYVDHILHDSNVAYTHSHPLLEDSGTSSDEDRPSRKRKRLKRKKNC